MLKAGSWHLVVKEADGVAVVGLDGLRATRLTSQSFEPPAGFSLSAAWAAHVAAAAALSAN